MSAFCIMKKKKTVNLVWWKKSSFLKRNYMQITWLRLMHFSFPGTMHHRWESFSCSAINVFLTFHANISSNCCWELFFYRTAALSIYRGMIFNADVEQLLNKVGGACDAGQTWKAKGQTECFGCCAWHYRCCYITWQAPLTHERETHDLFMKSAFMEKICVFMKGVC